MRAIVLTILFLICADIADAQTLTGVVVDGNGAAIENASVTLFEGNRVRAKTQTKSDGRFTVSGTITDRSRLAVNAKGFSPFERAVANDGVWDFTIVLQPASISGNVRVSVAGVETNQSRAAASIAVINIDSLTVTASRRVDDVIRQIAGFQLFRRSSSMTTNPTAQGANLRGLSGSGASRAAVLFDGLSINDALGGWTYWSRVPLISLEQIEVLNGGSSSIYGSGALSGAINMVPLKLGDNKLKLKLETSLASQNTGDASGVLLFSRGKWQADLVGDIFNTGGYIPVEEASRGDVDTPARSRHSNAILKLGRRFGEKNRVFVRGNLFAERRENGTSLTNNRTYFRQIAAGADLDGFTVRAFGEVQVYDQTFSSVSADRNSESLTRIQRVPSRAFGASATWRRSVSRHSIVAGGEIFNVRGFSDEAGFSAGQPTNVTRAGGEARDLSLFGQETWEITRRLALNLSARFDLRRNLDGITATRTLATEASAETRFADRTATAFRPRIGLAYDVTKNVSVYGNYSRSFRAPSLNELYRGFRVGNIVTNANAFLTPERAETVEAGGSAIFYNRKLITRAIVYQARVHDPVVSVTIAATPALITRQRQNVGSTTSRGLELALESSPTDGFDLNASYLLVDAKISDFPASLDLVGARLPQVPRHNFSTQIAYRYRTRWTLSSQFRAASSQLEDDRNTLSLRPYLTLDTRFSYKFPHSIEAFVSAENMLNSRYDIARTPVRSVAAPRSVRIGLRFDLSKL